MENTTTSSARYVSVAARAAKASRQELKAAYPNVKFRVTSHTYSGGDSIDVSYMMTLAAPKSQEVEKLLSKYEAGHFDGMTDMYEYKPNHSDLAVNYLFVHANMDQLAEQFKPAFMKYWGLETERDDEARTRTGMFFAEALRNYLNRVVLA